MANAELQVELSIGIAERAGSRVGIAAIDRDYLMRMFASGRAAFAAGVKPEAKQVKPVTRAGKSVVVLSIDGPIDYRCASWMCDWFGMVDLAKLQGVFDSLVNDAEIGTIVLDIDSPGGSSVGVSEFAQKIFAAREKKRIVSIANPLSASAAFWLSSSATESYVMPSGMVGSVGVYMMHVDYSEMLKQDGIAVNFISAGEKKTDGNAFQPLSDTARETYQGIVDEIYDSFVSDVARNRNVSGDVVKEQFGKGSIVTAKGALQAGMVDGILTLDDLVARELSRVNESESRGKAFLSNAKKAIIVEESIC